MFTKLVSRFTTVSKARPHRLWIIPQRLGSRLPVTILLSLAVLSARAGEKIRISEGSDKVQLPGRALQDDPFSRPLEFLNSRTSDSAGSLVPSLPPPSQTGVFKKEQLEKLDRKSWMTSEPGALDQDAALKKIFGVREYSLESLEKQYLGDWELSGDRGGSKTRSSNGNSVEDPFTARRSDGRKPNGSGKQEEAQLPGMNGAPSRGGLDPEDPASSASTIIPELNLNQMLNPSQAIDPLGLSTASFFRPPIGMPGVGSAFRPLTPADRSATEEREARAREFQNLLKGETPLLRMLNNPLQSQADSTKQEINPVTGRRLDSYSQGTVSVPGADPLAGAGTPGRGAALESINTKILGASSFTPTVTAPPAAPVLRPSPPVLEFPRRRF